MWPAFVLRWVIGLRWQTGTWLQDSNCVLWRRPIGKRHSTFLLLATDTRRRLAEVSSRMRKNHPHETHLPACVARCRRKSLQAKASRRRQRTPLKCPPGIEIRPAIRLWYVWRIVLRPARESRNANTTDKQEKPRSLVATRLSGCVRPKHHFHEKLSAHTRKMRTPETAGESFPCAMRRLPEFFFTQD